MSELIDQHRDELPFSDQLTTMDPPAHRDHRHLVMRQLTPKRLKENEEFVWRLADRQIDEFLEGASASSSATTPTRSRCSSSPTSSVCPRRSTTSSAPPWPADRAATRWAAPRTRWRTTRWSGSTTVSAATSRTAAVEPRHDVLTALATTTFPNGELPEVIDVVRVAANVFAAGQETTVRLLGTALQLIGEHPDLQQRLRERRDLIPNFVEEALRIEAPVKGDFRLARRRTDQSAGVDIPAGATLMVLNGAANRDPRHFDDPAEFRVDRDNAREHLAFGRGVHSCPGGSLARMETRVSIERLLDRTERRSASPRPTTAPLVTAVTSTCRPTSSAA